MNDPFRVGLLPSTKVDERADIYQPTVVTFDTKIQVNIIV
jgi:hypothetical protein